jgi:hypothetical protein
MTLFGPDPDTEPQEPVPARSRRAFRLGPPLRLRRRSRRQAAGPSARLSLAEWHLMTAGQREVAWTQLRAWVTWLHDRYELGVEERLPRCWADHPGIIEELWALKAWREEIYTSGQPSGQAARYWHSELRQVIQAATTQYAAGCRTGHRRQPPPAAEDAELQRRWAAASPLAGIPAADLTASRRIGSPGHWVGPDAMADAIDTGQARPLGPSLPGYIHWAGTWWMPGAGGWTPVTDQPFTELLDAWAGDGPDPGAAAASGGSTAELPGSAAQGHPATRTGG